MNKNKTARDFYDQEAQNYKKMYEPGYEHYPANLIRLKLIIKRLNENKARKILDVGCGTAIPMIKLLKQGFDVEGFDYSKHMVEFGKFELESAKYSSNRVFHADLENNKTMPKRKFDGILALGVFPHIKKEKVALRNIKNCLTKNGKTYIEFRNELFAAFSMNKYSADFFLNELIELEKLPIK